MGDPARSRGSRSQRSGHRSNVTQSITGTTTDVLNQGGPPTSDLPPVGDMPEVYDWQPPPEKPWTAADYALLVKVVGSVGLGVVIVLLSFVLVIITNRDWEGWLAVVLPVTTYFMGHHQGSAAATGTTKDGKKG
jgi:hypothetical protein